MFLQVVWREVFPLTTHRKYGKLVNFSMESFIINFLPSQTENSWKQ